MSQQVEVYRSIKFHKLGSPDVSVTLAMTSGGGISGTSVLSGSDTSNVFKIAVTQATATPSTQRAIVGAETTFTTMTSGNLVGVRGELNMGGNCSSTAYLYGVQGKAITGAYTFSGTALAGVYGQLDVTGGTISAGNVAAVQANIYGATVVQTYAYLQGVYIEHAGGGTINSFIRMFGKSTYVFDIETNVYNNASATGTVTTNGGYIKVNIDGTTRYIGLGSAVT
jgi:hypothetical protein